MADERDVVVILRVSYIDLLFSLLCSLSLLSCCPELSPKTIMSLHDKFLVQLIDYWPIPLDQLIDSIDWPILSRYIARQVNELGTVTNVYNPNETNNAVERMSRTFKKKKKRMETKLWRVLISKWWNFSLTFYVTWGNVIFVQSLHVTILICNETVRMDGTFVTSVQQWDADARNQCRCLTTVFSCSPWGVLMDQWMLNVWPYKAVLFICTWLWVK